MKTVKSPLFNWLNKYLWVRTECGLGADRIIFNRTQSGDSPNLVHTQRKVVVIFSANLELFNILLDNCLFGGLGQYRQVY